ncbi:hypothetical protein BC830DRAFT_373808 [Chytriomyces sp. MP71]|nr:hypothetical protein BC830DRAFT_373808 [Chytriomyces sp. MP71]
MFAIWPATLDAEILVTSVHVTPNTLFSVRAVLTLYAYICLAAELYVDTIDGDPIGVWFTDWTWFGIVLHLSIATANSYIYVHRRDGLHILQARPQWAHLINWTVYALAATYCYIVSIIFWTLLVGLMWDGADAIHHWTATSLHAGNSAIMLLEAIVGRTPMHIAFLIPTLAFALLYLAEAFLYHATTGQWIYPFLDTSQPDAVGFYVGILFGFVVVYFVVWGLHAWRDQRRSRMDLRVLRKADVLLE